jgi:formylglycine-generating enzyme required for sulfatase activity
MLLLLKIIICGLLFVLSSGIFFRERFSDNRFLFLLAGLVALASSYFLFQDNLARAVRIEFDKWFQPQDPPPDPPPKPEPPQAGRIAIGAAIIHNPQGREFLPGAGKTESFKDCLGCPEMVVVPQGSFTMGSPKDEPERLSNEGPQHRVTIAKPFAVGRFAVTFAEWDACAADGGCGGFRPADEGWGRGELPAINVNWDDAKAYAKWLADKTGKNYRLLSEAEREYVTRAGSKTPFWWGSPISPELANYDANYTYGSGEKGQYRQRTVPVLSFRPNPWGLYQVHGNVWEWTEDCWHGDYAGAPADGSAWTSRNCASRVLRGGSWNSNPAILRAGFRIDLDRDARLYDFGLRVARALNP